MRRELRGVALAAALSFVLAVAACAPMPVDTAGFSRQPALAGTHFETRDGLYLPYRHWPAATPEKAVLVALHGFNDYSNFLDEQAKYLTREGVDVYAYDQRGFGAGQFRGRWFVKDQYAWDAADFVRLVKARHPTLPVYLLGDSMGGAVAMLALTSDDPPPVKGTILAAPAVWGRVTMPWYQRASLWIAAHTAPAMPLTASGLDIHPSDNIPMLRALGRDPLIIKGTRVDAVYGLVDMMDAAFASAARLDAPVLILYGGKDDIVPKEPVRRMLKALPPADAGHRRVAVYTGAYHMLLRDLNAQLVWHDVASWIADPSRPLPSGAEKRVAGFLSEAAAR